MWKATHRYLDRRDGTWTLARLVSFAEWSRRHGDLPPDTRCPRQRREPGAAELVVEVGDGRLHIVREAELQPVTEQEPNAQAPEHTLHARQVHGPRAPNSDTGAAHGTRRGWQGP